LFLLLEGSAASAISAFPRRKRAAEKGQRGFLEERSLFAENEGSAAAR
jgi:hypothetical protein